MHDIERILKTIVEKYENTICFMADKNQCHMEAIESRIVWILLMGYEVDELTLETYAQHLLSKPMDEKEERFGTFKEKDLDLHKQFTGIERKRKIRKEVEQLAEKMGITREVVQRDREKITFKEEDMVKQQVKSISPLPKQAKSKQSKSSPISVAQKVVPPPKPQSSSIFVVEKKKKEKPMRKYVVVEEEIESDEEVREVKKTATYARVVRKPLSSEVPPVKKAKTQGDMEYTLVNLCLVISKDEIQRILKLVQENFRSKHKVNKIIFGKFAEIAKETKRILKKLLKENQYQINPEKDDFLPKEQLLEDTSILKVLAEVLGDQRYQSFEQIDLIEKEVANNTTANLSINDSSDIIPDPLVIDVNIEKTVEEIGKVTDEHEEVNNEKDVGVSMDVEVVKEKGEEKIDKASVIMARATDKGKQIDADEDEFSHGPIDLSTLSPIQALKLATLAQIKASEDLFMSASKEKEVISLATKALEKILSHLKKDSSDTPFGKLKDMLYKVESDFESLEKAVDEVALKRFNDMRLKTTLKAVEGDRVSLNTVVKSVEDALDEGGKIYKSCLILPKFIVDIDEKIRDHEGQLADIAQYFGPH